MTDIHVTSPAIGVTPFGSISRIGDANLVDTAVARARQALAAGIDRIWFSQQFEYDSISLAGFVGREVPEITVGTAVVPIPGLHPLFVSNLAQTAQAATRGRFTLGLGLGLDRQARDLLGVTHDRPAQRLRELLIALQAALSDGSVNYHGELVTAVAPATATPGAQPAVPVLVGTMGPQALKVTGELADGAITFMASPDVIAEHILPVISAAARAAGRPAPRLVAMVPAIVTDDVASARAAFAQEFAIFDRIPAFIRLVSLAGQSRAADLGLCGDEETVAAGIRRYLAAGATEVIVSRTNLLGDETRLRTWQLLGALAREPGRAVPAVPGGRH
jgi:F420-dependent oxidoreductase-like protein